jgi:hypothetical protein
MKTRIIKLTPELLLDALRGKASSLPSNLPNDLELLAIKYDAFSKQLSAIVRSDSFEDVGESFPIPEFDIVYAETSKPVLQPKINFKPEIKTVKRPRTQISQGTGGVEKEFSAEQRALLSFTAEGDYVVVKPVQYLKAEWDEINEVVRSIGGKWVKGDIISYWVIPLQPS